MFAKGTKSVLEWDCEKQLVSSIFWEVAFSLIEGGFCSFVIDHELVINSLLSPPSFHNNGSKRLLNTSPLL